MRDFSRSLPMALMRAREAVMRGFRPSLSEHDLTEQQFRVLRALDSARGPVEFAHLAAQTFLLGPSLSRIVSNLENRRLVAKTPVLHDGRRSNVTITSDGRNLVSVIAPHSERQYATIEAAVGEQRLEELYELLNLLATLPNASPDTDVDARRRDPGEATRSP